MRVLGIDPGFGRCGVAVIDHNNGKDVLLFSDCIETPTTNTFHERLLLVGKAVEDIIERYKPTDAALELIFFSKNQKTALQVAEARGVLLYVLLRNGLEVSEHNPMEIKIAMTGYGRASKNQVMEMVQRLIITNHPITHDDEYDAIAVALTHTATHRALI